MIATVRAELVKLTRPRVVIASGILAAAFAVLTTLLVFSSAKAEPSGAGGRIQSIAQLSEAGGATQAFATGVSFAGLLLFVVIIANVASEFTQGTFRSLLMRQPHRLRLLTGKLLAIVTFVTAFLLVTEVLVWGVSALVAPSQDISTSQWYTASGFTEALADLGRALFGAAAWITFGTTVAVIARSTPLALGIGIAWAGPIEHITVDSWAGANRWFPGLLLEAVAANGTTDVTLGRALLLGTVFTAAALVASLTVFARRDVTT
jgi:ABC-2 type transport system permease protein